MKNPIYRFYVNRTEVYPHYKSIKKKYALESNQSFFRTSLEGDIKLVSQDYLLVKNASVNDTLTFVVQKYNDSTGQFDIYYQAEFNKTDCEFDDDNKICKLKVSDVDKYTKVLNNYSNTYDLIKLAPKLTRIDMYRRIAIQSYVRGSSIVTTLLNGTYFTEEAGSAIDSNDELVNKYHFAQIESFIEIEIRDSNFSQYNGIYTGDNKNGSILTSSTNKNYRIRLRWNGYIGSIAESVIEILDSSDNVQFKAFLYLSNTAEDYVVASGETITFGNGATSFNVDLVFAYAIYQRLICGLDSINGTPTYDIPYDDFTQVNKDVYKKCIGLKGGLYLITDYTIEEPTKYGQNDYGKYFTSQFISEVAGLGRLLPIDRNTWANTSLWYAQDSVMDILEKSNRQKFKLKDAYDIGSVIQAMLNEIDPSIKHYATPEYSEILYSESNPLGLDKVWLFLTQKTNILKGDYDQAARKAELTFESLMNMLRDCFRCYWFIDDENRFRIEHIKWFMNGHSYSSQTSSRIDLANLTNSVIGKAYNFSISKFKYDKSDLASRYEFSWPDDVTEIFSTEPILIKDAYVEQNKSESISISDFSTDIDLMLSVPSNFSEDGFALIGAVKNSEGGYEIPLVDLSLIDDEKREYDTTAQNGYLSWTKLLEYYMYDMPGRNISISAVSLYVKGVKRCMTQEVKFPSSEDPDVLGLINTGTANGQIQSMSVDFGTRQVEATIAFEPS